MTRIVIWLVCWLVGSIAPPTTAQRKTVPHVIICTAPTTKHVGKVIEEQSINSSGPPLRFQFVSRPWIGLIPTNSASGHDATLFHRKGHLLQRYRISAAFFTSHWIPRMPIDENPDWNRLVDSSMAVFVLVFWWSCGGMGSRRGAGHGGSGSGTSPAPWDQDQGGLLFSLPERPLGLGDSGKGFVFPFIIEYGGRVAGAVGVGNFSNIHEKWIAYAAICNITAVLNNIFTFIWLSFFPIILYLCTEHLLSISENLNVEFFHSFLQAIFPRIFGHEASG